MSHLHLPSRTVERPEPAAAFPLGLAVGSGLLLTSAVLWSAMTNHSLSPLTWYVARSSGLMLYLLSVVLLASGIGGRAHTFRPFAANGLLLSLHTYGWHLFMGMLVLHAGSILIDPTMTFNPSTLAVPFRSPAPEPWTGFGILSTQLFLVTGSSSLIRRIIGYRTWKWLHWLAIPAFVAGLVHGIGTGADTTTLPVFSMYVVTVGWLLVLIIIRVMRHNERNDAREKRRIVPYTIR